MTAVVASSAGAEWEMVYMVSWVAMPTMAALVVMLARWKGKRPTPNVPPSSFPLISYPPEESSQMGSENSLPKHCRKRTGKAQRKERHEKIVRRVTSCPDFAVVRVVKTGVKNGRQLSYADLRLQEEIARLADKLLERQCERGPGCKSKWGDGFGCEYGEGKVGSCGFDSAHECDCIGSPCDQQMSNAKGFLQGGSLSDRGKKACATLDALLAKRRAAMQRKRAENFTTKGTLSAKHGVFDTGFRGPVQTAAAPPEMHPVGGKSVKEKFVATGVVDRLSLYDQLWPNLSMFDNARCLAGYQSGELRRLAESSVVRFWANKQGSIGVSGNGLEQMPLVKPGVSGPGLSKASFGLWSVTSNGVVETWDARVCRAPLFQYILPLQQRGDSAEVGGLKVTGSQLRVLLTEGGMITLDGRKYGSEVLGEVLV